MLFVSGGTGMLGAHLLYNLAQKGHKITAIKRAQSNTEQTRKIFGYYSDKADALFDRISWAEADMLNYAEVFYAMKDAEYVYHTAAQVSFNPKLREKIINENTAGTRNMVNAALEHGVKKFCHVSSIAALGSNKNAELIDELKHKNDIESDSGYGVSKFISETEVWRAAEEGLNAVIVNPSVILGAGNWLQGSPSLISTIAEGFKFYTEGKTGFCDVRDTAEFMTALMQSDITNERFIINSENLSYKKLFELIAGELGVKAPSIKAGKAMMNVARILDSLRSTITRSEARITKETVKAAQNVNLYSAEKAERALNFTFRPVKQSLQDFCRLYKEDTEN